MPLLRTDGIVLRTWEFGEHDRLVALYTRDLGRLAAVARGARRIRSRFGAALELFTWGDVVGFEREGRALVRLDHFDIRRSFRALREDLLRLAHGARMLEAVSRLTAERDPQVACFALLLRGLRALERHPALRVQLAFTLRLLDLLGHRPRLDRCGGCGGRVGTVGVVFDGAGGGVACVGCRPAGALAVSSQALGALRGLQAASWDARLAARIAPGTEQEADTLLERYVAMLGGGSLRSVRFLATAVPAESRPSVGAGGDPLVR